MRINFMTVYTNMTHSILSRFVIVGIKVGLIITVQVNSVSIY